MASRILVVANRTAATPALLAEIRARAADGVTEFHLVVPSTPHGLHRVVDPEETGGDEADRALKEALPLLTEAAGRPVTGEVGDAAPLTAIEDAVNAGAYDEIIISTLPTRVSKWMKLDLPSKAGGLGLPVTHVSPEAVPADRTS
jgi:hypothetical protein